MKIKFFCPHWGSKHLDFTDFLGKVKAAGYDGVEMSVPLENSDREEIVKKIKKYGLLHIAQHWETVITEFQEHKKEYRERLLNLTSTNPLFINSQTGKDFFSFEQNAELIKIAADVSKQTGIKIIHETHRGKFSYAAHVMFEYMARLPDLRIGFDLSHWCAVAETFLHDQPQTVKLAISRADHIHARVGFPEGPQISDPRAPEWKEAVDIHVEWWKRIVERNRAEGKTLFTITPEFGPYPYMTILPHTQQPIANQWEVNVYMKDMLKSLLSKVN
jgi:sugar phosphate isomerase/epimerase